MNNAKAKQGTRKAGGKFRIVDKYVALDPWPDGFGYEHSDLSDIFCKGGMSGWVEPFPILGAQTHAGLTEASNGDLLLLFADIVSDLRPGDSLSIVRSSDWGKTWQTPVKFPDFRTKKIKGTKLRPDSLMTTSSGTIFSTYMEFGSLPWKYKSSEDYKNKTGKEFLRKNYGLYLLSSTDNGYNWKKSGKTICSSHFEIFAYGRIIELKDKSLLLPTTGHSRRGEMWRAGALKSEDGGKTWKFNTIAYPGDETPVIELTDGKLLAVNRAGVPGITNARLARHVSTDGGKTWSPHELTIMVDWPDSVITTGYPLLHISPAGTLMLIYRAYDTKKRMFCGPAVSYSKDEGKTWQGTLILDDPKGTGPYYGINIGGWDIINLPNGKMLILFSLIHKSKYIVANVLEENI